MTTDPTALDRAPEELRQMVDPANPRQVSTLDRFLSEMSITDGPPEPADEEAGGEAVGEEPSGPPPAAEAPASQVPPKKLAGKFDSPADLEKAYQELERKLGERAPAAPAAAVEPYTRERGVEVYGETVAAAIEAAEINPFEMAARVQAGEDVTAFVDALVNKGRLPRPVVEAYLQGVRPAAPPAEAASSINDNPEAVAALRQSVGGDVAFSQLSQWAAANLTADEKAQYQQAVDTGNVHAVQWALRSFQARQQASQVQRSEPLFLGGGAQSGEPLDVYETRSDWQRDRYAKNENGQERYVTDESYREKVDAKHQRSKRAGRW